MDKLAKLTDPHDGGAFREFSAGDGVTTYTLGPVDDVEEFASRLGFLAISKIEAEKRIIHARAKDQ